MKDDLLTIGAAEFKARCLSVFRELEARKYSRVVITRHGKPVAEMVPPREEPPRLWGALRGSVEVEPGVDLTAPVLDEALDARSGRLHR